MSRIRSKLYIGNYRDAQNITMLKRNKISHILCAAGELRAVFPNNFTYKMIRASDHSGFNIGMFLDGAADFIHRSIKNGTGILVHCHMGISRSTTCVMAYLMKYENMTMTSAFSLCKRMRPMVSPNPGFMTQLRKYQERLKRIPKAHEARERMSYSSKIQGDITNLRQSLPISALHKDNFEGIGGDIGSSLKSRHYSLHTQDHNPFFKKNQAPSPRKDHLDSRIKRILNSQDPWANPYFGEYSSTKFETKERAKSSGKYLNARAKLQKHKERLSKSKVDEWKKFKNDIINLEYTKKPRVPNFSRKKNKSKLDNFRSTKYTDQLRNTILTNPLKSTMNKYFKKPSRLSVNSKIRASNNITDFMSKSSKLRDKNLINPNSCPSTFLLKKRKGVEDLHRRYQRLEKNYSMKKYGIRTGYKSNWRTKFEDLTKSRDDVKEMSQTSLLFKNPRLTTSGFRGVIY